MPTEEGQKLRYVCSTCSRPFSCKRELIKHQYMHREKPQFVCSHCNKIFITESNYKRHLNSLQNNEKKRYCCNNCGKPFRRLRDLESHHDSEHRDDKAFRCGVCQAEFSWRENLLKHEQVHDLNPHVCGACGRKFIDLTSLLVHKRTHHTSSRSEPQKKPVMAKEEIEMKQQVDDGKPFTCHICGRGFKFDFSYQAHLDGHVIPAAEGDCHTSDQAVASEPPVNSSTCTSKSLYVQMDSEGIIDLPALNSANNEEVEIIVEVGNVASSGAVAISSPEQQILINKSVKPDTNADTSNVNAVGENKTLDDSSNTLKDQTKVEKEAESGRIITFYEPDKKGENEKHVTVASRAEAVDQSSQISYIPSRPYSSRPKKPPKRKRERTPFQFNCVMTDDKPFICSTCGEAFRWEISLQVHTKVHTDGKVPGIRKMYMSGRTAVKKTVKTKNGSHESGIKKSRIVYQRHSSEEEEEEEEDAEDAYAFRNDREEDKSPPLSYHRAKKFAEKRFAAESADVMLQEYLAGGDLTSDDECDDVKSEESAEHHYATGGKYQSDDGWKKGKAILRKKKSGNAVKLKPADDTQTNEADGEKPLARESGSEVMVSGDQIAFATDCSANHSQTFAVTCVGGAATDPVASQSGVVGSCLVASFPFDLTAVTSDDRIAMAAAYSATGQPVSVPVVIQNGFKQEEAMAGGGQLTMLQCIPIQTSSLEIEDALLNSGTSYFSTPKETSQEVASAGAPKFIPLVQNASSEITAGNQSNENDSTTYEPTEIQSTINVSVSHVTSEFNITETHMNQAKDATNHPTYSKSSSSTRVIFFADENPAPQIDIRKDEQPLSFNASEISSLNQKISAGLVALKAIVSGTRCIGLKAEEGSLENSALKSNCSLEGEFDRNPNGVEDTMISESVSGNHFLNKEQQTVCEEPSVGGGLDIPWQAQSEKGDGRLGSRKCTRCGKLFTSRRSYVKHLRRHRHVKINYTTCAVCSKRFFSKASLEQHCLLHAP